MKRLHTVVDGLAFSQLAYGTWRGPAGQPSAQELNGRLNLCLDLGITTIDTAEIYGGYTTEELLGRALALSPGLRGRLELVTKGGIYAVNPGSPGTRTHHYDATGDRLVATVEKSLRLLGTDRLELFLVHRPDWLTRADDTSKGLNRLVKSGKVRAVGVSNYTASQVDLLASRLDVPVATNQVEFSLLHMDPMHDGVLHQCEKAGVSPMAWSPLAGGRIFDGGTAEGRRLGAAASEISSRYAGAPLDQLAYAWVLAHPSRPIAVVGSTRADRIRGAAGAAKITLDRQDWYALWQAAQGRRIP